MAAPTSENILGIFAKQPIRGQAKTRLARVTSDAFAERVALAMLEDTLDRLQAIDARRVLVYAPREGAAFFDRVSAGRYEFVSQCDGDLGARLRHFFAAARTQGHSRIVVIGTDSPTMPVVHVEDAFRHLQSADLVLGATLDGGYYLIGMGRTELPIFDGILWGSPQVFETTMTRVPPAARLVLSPPWYDVDTLEDWEMLASQVRMMRDAGIDPGTPRLEAIIMETSQCRKA